MGILLWLHTLLDYNSSSATACEAGDELNTTPMNKLKWRAKVEYTAAERRWANNWFANFAPDHPYVDRPAYGKDSPPMEADNM